MKFLYTPHVKSRRREGLSFRETLIRDVSKHFIMNHDLKLFKIIFMIYEGSPPHSFRCSKLLNKIRKDL